MSKDIAIIGIAGRFPDALNIHELYKNLAQGKDCLSEISKERIKSTSLPKEGIYRVMGYLDDVDKFDHSYFNISLAEAQTMEPNQRLLLEVVHEIFDSSGYSIDFFNGSKTSVYVNEATNDYFKLAEEITPTLITGNAKEFLSSRIARFFNLRGFCQMINTSCSSALVAVHQACKDLIIAESDLALVCGLNIDLFPYKNNRFTLGLLSEDGKSRAFSSNANGMSRGELVAGVLLKPLDKAVQDKDIIYSIIKGSAVNNNANRSSSLTAPESVSLAEVMQTAWQDAGINPEEIEFIEAHGSGTKLGDSLEFEGITNAFKQVTEEKGFCAISTVKSNIGHGVFAAGMSGLIKVVLSLKHNKILPNINFDEPNPVIDFKNSGVFINTELMEWEKPDTHKRFAGINSIGFSGVNCHLVMEEGPKYNYDSKTSTTLFTFSAKSPQSLISYLIKFRTYLQKYPVDFNSVSYTLSVGRNHNRIRLGLIADSTKDLISEITKIIEENKIRKPDNTIPKTFYILSDQKISELLIKTFSDKYSIFKDNFDRCTNYCCGNICENIKSFAFQFAMYHLFIELNINISNILCIGIGKIIKDVISGSLTLEDGIKKSSTYKKEENLNVREKIDVLIQNELKNGHFLFVGITTSCEISKELIRSIHYNKDFRLLNLNSENILYDYYRIIQQFYQNNENINWVGFFNNKKHQKAEIPAYHFEPIRCWIREEPFDFSSISNSDKDDIAKEILDNGTKLEIQISKCWSASLKIKITGLNDNFFEIGGNSIEATKVINNIKKTYFVDLDFEDIYDFPTIKSLANYIESKLSVSQKVTIIWKNVLKLEGINEDDNFFELGGHSLIANQLINEIRKEFAIEISFDDIFYHPTLKELIEYTKEQENKLKNILKPIIRVEKKQFYPASSAQQRMFYQQEINASDTSYNIPIKILIEGDANAIFLEQSLRELIERHESLRTKYDIKDNHVVQIIGDTPELNFNYCEISENEIDIFFKNFVRPFNLRKDPVIRATLIKLNEYKYFLCIDIHHIATDFYSNQILAKDFLRILNQEILLPNDIQYKDFTLWQKDFFQSSVFSKQKEYWLTVFKNDVPHLNLKYDFPKKDKNGSSKGEYIIFYLNGEIKRKLDHAIKESNVTTFIYLLAVYNILLYKHTMQEDIVIGSTVSGRTHHTLQDIAGMFVNMVALRNNPSGNKDFYSFLEEVKYNALSAYKNQDYPIDELLRTLKKSQILQNNELFTTEFAMNNHVNNVSFELSHSNQTRYTLFPEDAKFSKFDLHFQLSENEEGIKIILRYSPELFIEETIVLLRNNFTAILEQVLADKRISINDILVYSPFEETASEIEQDLRTTFNL